MSGYSYSEEHDFEFEYPEQRKWPYSISIREDIRCSICRNKVLNHEPYVLEVVYTHGDEEAAEGTVHHIRCE